jgi:hypothetical protein
MVMATPTAPPEYQELAAANEAGIRRSSRKRAHYDISKRHLDTTKFAKDDTDEGGNWNGRY